MNRVLSDSVKGFGLSSPCQRFSNMNCLPCFLKGHLWKSLFVLYEALRQYLTRSSTKPELLLFSATLLTVGLKGRIDVTPISHVCYNIRDVNFPIKNIRAEFLLK